MQYVSSWHTCVGVQPAAALKVFQVLAGDDVKGTPSNAQPLLSAFLLHQRHKGIGSTAEVHNCVPIMQIEAEELCNLLQQVQLGEVATVAAVPASSMFH